MKQGPTNYSAAAAGGTPAGVHLITGASMRRAGGFSPAGA